MFFLFFKQKTAYEMRISDWSSDVCSSDLDRAALTATRDIRLSTGGALTLNGGSLIAGRDLALSAAAVSDSAAASALVDANRRHAGGSLSLARSEEHTSELQSLMRTSYAVLRLKKKNNTNHYSITNMQSSHI